MPLGVRCAASPGDRHVAPRLSSDVATEVRITVSHVGSCCGVEEDNIILQSVAGNPATPSVKGLLVSVRAVAVLTPRVIMLADKTLLCSHEVYIDVRITERQFH